MTTQLRMGFEEAVGWIITGAPTGPAGPMSALLDGIRVTVDAADPDILVELAVFAQDPDAPIEAAALDACRRLLGTEVADVLATRPAAGTVITVGDAPALPLWEHLAGTARALFLWQHDVTAPGLAALRVLAQARELAAIGATEFLREHAWEALPAVMALGRTAARRAQVVDRLSAAGRRELADAISALEAVLTGDEWDGTGRDEVGNVAELLRELTEADIEELLREPAEDADDGELTVRGFGVGGFAAGPRPQEVAVTWYPETEDLRGRLGDFAAEAFAGAIVEGTVPGRVKVEVPLRLGAAATAPGLTVRVHSWSGEILGEAPMVIRQDPQALPVASARVHGEAVPPGQEELGVHVDIALTALAPLDAGGLRRTARSLARRAGQRALLARYAGQLRTEEDSWDYCARMYAIGGDAARAATARSYAQAAGQRAAAGQREGWPNGPDWANDLLARWRTTAHAEITAADALPPAERIRQLRQVVRDLSAGASGLRELAQACQELSLALREHAGATEVDRASALALLREALRVRYLIGGRTEAERAARELTDAEASAVSPVDEDGTGHDD
jgi:hypothetical protein